MSRETRRLLVTAVVALLTLWALARVRFPDRPPAPNPVPPILDQLTQPTTYSDLASRVADVRARLADTLVPIVLVADTSAGARGAPADRVAALRIRDDLAATVIAPAARRADTAPLGVVAEDRGSGLTLVETPTRARAALPIIWSPRNLDQPRYVLASSAAGTQSSLHPSFIASLTPTRVPEWRGDVWALPGDATLSPGAVLFTEDAELIGVVAAHEGGVAVVPARTLLSSAEQLIEVPQKPPVELGVEVDGLTPQLAVAAGTESGVIVTWVDPAGIAAPLLHVGDVIQAVDAEAVASAAAWRVRAARMGVGDMVTLRVVRRGATRDVQLAFTAPPPQEASRLGLTLRAAAPIGAEVLRVERGSAAAAAGLIPGDLVTAVGAVNAPSPGRVRAAFAALERGELLLVAIRRGQAHRVVVIQR